MRVRLIEYPDGSEEYVPEKKYDDLMDQQVKIKVINNNVMVGDHTF